MPPHRTLAIIILSLLAISSTSAAIVALADTVSSGSGQFTIQNAAPGTPTFTLYEEDETTTTNTMDPQTEYALKITASDPNGYDDIDQIVVHIYYSTTTDGSAEPPASTSPQTYAKYVWTSASGWSLEGPTGSTWGIDTTQSRGPENAAGTTADWWLHFIPSKVATETATGTWYIKVEVYDKSGASNSGKSWGYTMNWYGEIAIDSNDQNFDFGTVSLGDTNKGLATPSDGYLDIYVVSNGDYKIQVVASDTSGQYDYWVGQSSRDQAEITTGTPGDSQIRLKVDSDSDPSAGTVPINPISSGYNDWITGSGPTSDGTASNGDGDHATAYLFLDVGPSGLLPDTYQGMVSFQVANG